MREIRFRAWDKQFQIMTAGLIPSTILLNDTRYGQLGLGNKKIGIFPASHFKLMQYTGLKDKNGKEIYEGDLVYFTGKTKRDKIRTYKVIWENERSRFIGKHIAYENQFMPIRLFSENHEVIGNIYENKELIK